MKIFKKGDKEQNFENRIVYPIAGQNICTGPNRAHDAVDCYYIIARKVKQGGICASQVTFSQSFNLYFGRRYAGGNLELYKGLKISLHILKINLVQHVSNERVVFLHRVQLKYAFDFGGMCFWFYFSLLK